MQKYQAAGNEKKREGCTMNFIFISPAFPANYENFCLELKKNGVNVLGIGDTPYDGLTDTLKYALTEYYKVESMENYDEMYRAVAFFCFKYGRIDWLESNNEYWLEQDAALRTDFNITSGFHTEDMAHVKYKSEMKACYKEAGVTTARYHLVEIPKDAEDISEAAAFEEKELAAAKAFIGEVGYPVIAKPDNGVGASDTWKLKNEEDVLTFFKKREWKTYIMEEFVPGEICSYDAIIDSHGVPIFETGNVTPVSIMDMVNSKDNVYFYIEKKLPKDMRETGRACVKSFGVRSRFVHFEFFRLTEDHVYLGKKGKVIGLEVNMRPCGGPAPDMMNYANSVNTYKLWADMIVFDERTIPESDDKAYCIYVGRRKGKTYQYSYAEVMERFGEYILGHQELPEVIAEGMGDFMYLARFKTMREVNAFVKYMVKSA